jgi:crossover junction endodeoxyribonuclease RuvC
MRTMGIDLGIAKIAWSVWDDDLLVDTGAYKHESGHRSEQLSALCHYIYDTAEQVNPDAIWIEDILIGNNRKYSIKLAQTMGAVLTALTPWCGSLLSVNVSTWKKEVIGNGHAKKEDIQNYIWNRDSAYSVLCDGDQDRFDAACIGYYGVVIANRAGAMAQS